MGVVSGAENVTVVQDVDGSGNDTFTFSGGTVGISESVYQSGDDPDTILCGYAGSITATLIRAQ